MQDNMKEFQEAMKTAVEWFRNNCNPYQKIIISGDGVEMVSGEMAFPVKPVD